MGDYHGSDRSLFAHFGFICCVVDDEVEENVEASQNARDLAVALQIDKDLLILLHPSHVVSKNS